MSVLIAWQRGADSTHHAVGGIVSLTVASLPAFGPWAVGTPSRAGPLARKYLPGFPYS